MGFVVHTSAFTAHRSAIPGKLWFILFYFFFASVFGWKFVYDCTPFFDHCLLVPFHFELSIRSTFLF